MEKKNSEELLKLKQRIAELEALAEKKQFQLEFKDKMIEIAEKMYGIDIKKNEPPDNTNQPIN